MANNLEEFRQWVASTQERFNAWNEKQPENRKIKNRLPFTLRFNRVKFLNFDKKNYVGKDGKPGVNTFKKMKFIGSDGSESACKVQSPSVIAPRGYTTIKTDNGPLKCIPSVYDIENPDHELFISEIDRAITTPAVHEIMKEPGTFGIQEIQPIPEITDSVLASDQYKMGSFLVKSKMAKIVNFKKLTKTTFDQSSPQRTIFLNPLDWQDKEKPDDPPVQMEVNIKLQAGVPSTVISPDHLYKICEGYRMDGGKLKKGEPQGFEHSPEINFQKLNVGSKPSTKTSCTSTTITRFQVAPKSDSQDQKNKYMDEFGVTDEYTAQLGMEELLAGLRSAAFVETAGKVPVGNTYNPMGSEGSNNSLPPQQQQPGSLLANLNSHQNSHLHNEQTQIQNHNTQQLSSSPHQMKDNTMEQYNFMPTSHPSQTNMLHQSMGLNLPPPITNSNYQMLQGNMMPSHANQASVDSSQLAFGDRLAMFNKQQNPTPTLNISTAI